MKCRNCAYPLWQLPPGDVRSVSWLQAERLRVRSKQRRVLLPPLPASSSRTKASGLLEEAEFDCASCGRHISMDDMILRPRAGHTRGTHRGSWPAMVGSPQTRPACRLVGDGWHRLGEPLATHAKCPGTQLHRRRLPLPGPERPASDPILLSIAPAAITAVAGILTIAFPTSSVFTDSPALVRFILVGGVILAGATLWASALTFCCDSLVRPPAPSVAHGRQSTTVRAPTLPRWFPAWGTTWVGSGGSSARSSP